VNQHQHQHQQLPNRPHQQQPQHQVRVMMNGPLKIKHDWSMHCDMLHAMINDGIILLKLFRYLCIALSVVAQRRLFIMIKIGKQGKTKKQCVQRFKAIQAIVLTQRAATSVST
jgi:hypothetical protein